MHIYYYYKDGYIYVLDSNHKLYRYDDNINIELILNTENLIAEYTKELKKKNKENLFKCWSEFNPQMQYHIQQFLQGFFLLQTHCLIENSDSSTYITILELVVIDFLNTILSKSKLIDNVICSSNQSTIFNRLKELQKDYEKLLNIYNIQKEEVSLAYLDNTIPKCYLKNTEFERIYATINKQQEEYQKKYTNLQIDKNILEISAKASLYIISLSELFNILESNVEIKKIFYPIQISFILLYLISTRNISTLKKRISNLEENELTLKRKKED